MPETISQLREKLVHISEAAGIEQTVAEYPGAERDALEAVALYAEVFSQGLLDRIVDAGLVWELRDNQALSDEQCDYLAQKLFTDLGPWLDGRQALSAKETAGIVVLLGEAGRLDEAALDDLTVRLSVPGRSGEWYARRILQTMSEGKCETALLEKFREAGCQFVVVGGVAAVLNGARCATGDVDICYEDTEENRERLAMVLESLGGLQSAQGVHEPRSAEFWQFEMQNLRIGVRRLDLLKRLCGVGMYDACRRASTHIEGYEVLNLEALMDAKWAALRDKDRVHLIELGLVRDSGENRGHDKELGEAEGAHCVNYATERVRDYMRQERLGSTTDSTRRGVLDGVKEVQESGYVALWAPGEEAAILEARGAIWGA